MIFCAKMQNDAGSYCKSEHNYPTDLYHMLICCLQSILMSYVILVEYMVIQSNQDVLIK